jgi:two-component system, NtrC family, response regulator HydG
MGRILVADDHSVLRRGLVLGLTAAGHTVEEASDGNAAIQKVHATCFDVVLTDLKMAGSSGLDILRTTRTLHPTTAVIMMTAFGSIDNAVEAIKLGAFDYVQKPCQIEEIETKVENALEAARARHEAARGRPMSVDFDRIGGSSADWQRVLDVVKKSARTSTTVLIRGETGTGKELIASAVHDNSLRKSRAFVRVNCAALHENLLESELFGHEKGAFTGADRQRIGRFEQADGGTLFLDEIGDMSLGTQAKILRVLQEHEFERVGGTKIVRVDVRLVAATNRDLPAMVQSGHFREDLFYRLNVVSVELPPLRDRQADIVPLAETFIRRFSAEHKKNIEGLEPDAQALLLRHNWPGNIRELENAIERATLLADGPAIAAGDLRLGDLSTRKGHHDQTGVVRIPAIGMALADIERHAIVEALRMSNWVQKDAARLLSISPRLMCYKIDTLGIDFRGGRGGSGSLAASR